MAKSSVMQIAGRKVKLGRPPIFVNHQSNRDLCLFADALQAQTMINRQVSCLGCFSGLRGMKRAEVCCSVGKRNTCFESLMNVFVSLRCKCDDKCKLMLRKQF